MITVKGTICDYCENCPHMDLGLSHTRWAVSIMFALTGNFGHDYGSIYSTRLPRLSKLRADKPVRLYDYDYQPHDYVGLIFCDFYDFATFATFGTFRILTLFSASFLHLKKRPVFGSFLGLHRPGCVIFGFPAASAGLIGNTSPESARAPVLAFRVVASIYVPESTKTPHRGAQSLREKRRKK